MMDGGAQGKRELTRKEASARASLLGEPRYHVALDLASGDETFGCTATVRFRCHRPGSDTWIDFAAAEIQRLELNGRPLDRRAFEGERIALPGLAAENTLAITARCSYSRNGIGLHRFEDPADGETYLYSDFEPREAHRVYPCFDQPDLKGTLTLEVTAPPRWEVLANAVPSRRPDAGAGGVWSFPPTPIMPTYVTAVVAGPYHAVRTRHRDLDLGVHCRRSIAADLDADEIFTITRQGFDFFTALFDRPYVFGKYDQVFVPEFNSGAMENAGCVTFNESMIFRAKVTEADREDRALVILHELAHMWFGNLVTMRWWDDLWLNESFATYMGQLALARATRFQNGWTSFARSEKPWATTQDQLPTTHPIVADVPDTTAARTQFDGISYAKGASALKQLVAWVGEEAFTAGIRRYFTVHAYGNADLAAFLDALAAASGRDLARWSRDWLEQAGVNTMAASYALDDSTSTHSLAGESRPAAAGAPRIGRFIVQQSASPEQPTLRPHRIAIGIYDRVPGELRLRRRFETDVEGAETRIPELEGEPEPDLILLNDQDLTYAKIRFDRRSRATVESSLATLRDPLARVLIWNAVWDEVRDAVTPASRYVDLVLGSIHGESDPGVMRSLLGNLATAIAFYRVPEDRGAERQRVASAALAALEAAAPASDEQLIWGKAFVSAARAPEHVRQLGEWLGGTNLVPGLAVDRELRWQITIALASLGVFAEDEIAAELAREDSDWSRRQAAGARAAQPTPAAKAAAWTAIAENRATPLATMRALMTGFMRLDQEAVIAPYVERYFAALRPLWESRDPELVIAFAGAMYPSVLIQPEILDRTAAELAKGELAPPIRRRLLEQQDQVARALRAQAADRKGKEAASCSAR